MSANLVRCFYAKKYPACKSCPHAVAHEEGVDATQKCKEWGGCVTGRKIEGKLEEIGVRCIPINSEE